LKLEQIEEMMQLNESQIRKRSSMQAELRKILDEEEQYWFKRSDESWLLKGDNNTHEDYMLFLACNLHEILTITLKHKCLIQYR
jgi:single-stranded DNA-specific DHH superfamily exonuclease